MGNCKSRAANIGVNPITKEECQSKDDAATEAEDYQSTEDRQSQVADVPDPGQIIMIPDSASDDSDLDATLIMDAETIEILKSASCSTDESTTGLKDLYKELVTMPMHSINVQRRGLGHLVTSVGRIAIAVSNIEESAAFYQLLGFKRIDRPEYLKPHSSTVSPQDEAWLTGSTLDLYLKKGTSVVQSREPVVGHLCFYVPKAKEAIQVLRRKTHIPFVVNTTRTDKSKDGNCNHSLRQAFIRDPDGQYIELSNCQTSSPFECKTKSDSFDPNQVDESKTISELVRHWLTYSDLRHSHAEDEVELTLRDEDVNSLLRQTSEGNIAGKNGFLNLSANRKIQQRLIRSKSTSYVDVLKADGIPLETKSINDTEECSDSSKLELGSLIESVNHLTLVVSNVDKALEFYTDVLGLLQMLPSSASTSQAAILIAGNVAIYLVEGKPDVNPGKEMNIVDGNITLNVSNMEEAYKILQAMKVPFRVNKMKHKGEGKEMLSEAYLRDPDGYNIAIGNYKDMVRYKFTWEQDNAEPEEQKPTKIENEIEPLPLAEQPSVVDPEILKNFLMRQKIDDDICAKFERSELKQILREAGNDAPTAMTLMKKRIHVEDGTCNEVQRNNAVVDEDVNAVASSVLCCDCY